MFLTKTHRFFNEASGGDGGGGGGAPAAPAAPTPSPAPAPAPAPAAASPAPAPASVLAGGAPASAPAADWAAPEKYLVKGDDGSVNWEATARKIDEGRASLEKRFGAGDVPPADVSGYKITVPEAHQETLQGWDPAADQALQSFLGNAHKAGFTQAQVDLVIGEFGRVTAEMKAAGAPPSPEQLAETCTAELSKVWGDQASFDKNAGLAFKAANAIAGKAGLTYDDLEAAGLGNNPAFLRLMAALGPEMAEDTPEGTGASAPAAEGWKDEVARLKAEKDALPQKDRRREAIQQQINSLYEKHIK